MSKEPTAEQRGKHRRLLGAVHDACRTLALEAYADFGEEVHTIRYRNNETKVTFHKRKKKL